MHVVSVHVISGREQALTIVYTVFGSVAGDLPILGGPGTVFRPLSSRNPGIFCDRCVEIPSAAGQPSRSYLFIEATVECSATGWQAPLWILLVLLLLSPGLLVWFLRFGVRKVSIHWFSL